MIDVVLTVVALVAGGLSLELYSATAAPLGYQDDHGFRLGPEAQLHAEDCPSENPS
jgi:hypothetical protein